MRLHLESLLVNTGLLSRLLALCSDSGPPLPKYKSTFDIVTVLNYVASLVPFEFLPMKMLTLKAFLIANRTISRVSSVSRLGMEV